jgi:hypothetical protein
MIARFLVSPWPVLLTTVAGLSQPCRAHVALIAPNGGEILVVGSTFTIQWQVVVPHNTLNWDLEYSISGPSGPWLPIAIDLPVALTSYQWTVPNTPSTQVRVRVTQDNSGTDYDDISASDLTIAVAAAYTPFGQGCAGSSAVASLAPLPGELPRIGTTSHLRAANLAVAAHPVLFAIGFSDTQANGPGGVVALPFSLSPYGLTGCTQYVSVDLTDVAIAAGGQADWTLTVPNDPSLSGRELHVQAAAFEPAAIAVSNGVTVSVGY